ncbi:hypothetical protein HJC99_00500 [Candidatus Saccharibacteria bacterium]|nr:hypothetical protein [Candidatus Saccharibacteria bacterium]
MKADEIAASIKSAKISNKPVLIAIEGFGGSGKSTFAGQLTEALGDAAVIGIDDFIVKEKMDEPAWEGSFDLMRLKDEVLIPASRGQTIRYHKLLWATNNLSEAINVPFASYLIVEGISSYHPDIADYYDYKIWIGTPIEVAKARGQARDAGNENESKWDVWAQSDLDYQHKYHPEQAADFTVENK